VTKERNIRITGRIHKVTIELKEMKAANAELEKDAMREANVCKIVVDIVGRGVLASRGSFELSGREPYVVETLADSVRGS
jgi:hypothetical protein